MSTKPQEALIEQLLKQSVHELDDYREGKMAGIYLSGSLAGQHYPNGPAKAKILGKVDGLKSEISRFTKGHSNHHYNYHQILVRNDWLDQDIQAMLKGQQEEALRDPQTLENGTPIQSPEVTDLGRIGTASKYQEVYQGFLDETRAEWELWTGDLLWVFFIGETYAEYTARNAKRFQKQGTQSKSSLSVPEMLKAQKAKLKALTK